MNSKKIILSKNLVLSICILLIFSKYVYAYINPGSITVVLQIILAVAAGAILAFRAKILILFNKLISIIKKKKD